MSARPVAAVPRRTRATLVVAAALAVVVHGPSGAEESAPSRSGAFDGTWFVSLDCADTQDRTGLVKGYQFLFDAHIVDGRLDGQYGTPGQSSSLHLDGDVRDGGVLEIRAAGVSGPADYVVGRAPRGTPYVYTMGGRLDGVRGEATRREVRPCIARFVKRDAVAR